MATISSILVPIDGSDSSMAALAHAITLAEDYNARIVVFHVIPETDSLTVEARSEAERAMEAAIEPARESLGQRLVHRTAIGDPVREIVLAAQEETDLIVIGTHARTAKIH